MYNSDKRFEIYLSGEKKPAQTFDTFEEGWAYWLEASKIWNKNRATLRDSETNQKWSYTPSQFEVKQ